MSSDSTRAGSGGGGAEPPVAVVRAVRRILTPFVRFLIAQGVTFPALGEILKAVFVDVAEREFTLDDRPQTDSRISLLTGVHRKDVKRLRNAPPIDQAPPRSVSLGAQLVSVWTGSEKYRDREGHVMALPRQAGTGEPSFDSLVESVSKDVRPRAVLDEWLRLGVVHIDDDGMISLNAAAFVPREGFTEKTYYFGRNLGDHVAAAAHNVLEDGAPKLERSVYYDGLTPASVEALKAAAERRGMEALSALNEKALRLAEADAGKDDAHYRMNFGVYFFDTQAEGDEVAGSGEENGGEGASSS